MSVATVLSLVGVGAASVIGVLHALRHRVRPGLLLAVALMSALAGGVIRDTVIGRVPVAVTFWPYAATALVGMAVACWSHQRLERWQLPVLAWLDAVGVGSFAVGGTAVALEHHLSVLPACGLGVVTAIGGGIVRDLILGDTPSALSRDPVVVVSALGAMTTCALWETGELTVTSELIVIAAVAALQLLAATSSAATSGRGAVLPGELLPCAPRVVHGAAGCR